MKSPPATTHLKTYQEWNNLGFYVNRGARSVGRNKHNLPLFSAQQVHKAKRPVFESGRYTTSNYQPPTSSDDHESDECGDEIIRWSSEEGDCY